jgi:hypothetical protein
MTIFLLISGIIGLYWYQINWRADPDELDHRGNLVNRRKRGGYKKT